jgi:DNA repair/transcription protein MET18/MMS19
MIAVPHDALTKDKYAVVKPLWMQKVYFELVKPLLLAATGADPGVEDQLIKTNFSVGVLALIKHMSFSIYEDDADKVLLVCISVAQNIGGGSDLEAAVRVMKHIIAEASDKAQDHLRSIIFICIEAFSSRRTSTSSSSAKEPPAWLPSDYAAAGSDAEVQGACGKLGLDIVGGLPKIFESRYLVPFAPQVQRELTAACGHKMRDVRRSARLARAAWVDLK